MEQQDTVERVRTIVRGMERAGGGNWSFGEELVGEGLMGFAEANNRYDETRGANRWTYALHRVRGRIIEALRRGARDNAVEPCGSMSDVGDPGGERPAARQAARLLADRSNSGLAFQPPPRTMESTLTAREAALLLARTLRGLSYRKRTLVIECALKARPVKKVGYQLGLCRARSQRLLRAAVEEVRVALAEQGYSLADFV